jgi:hypothetical protein
MRVRHRIPSIFNLSMVDVLCCALGCVILLWLLNLRQAKQYEEDAGEQSRQSAALLATAESDREAARRTIRELEGRVAALEDDLSASGKRAAAHLARAEELAKKLDTAEGRIKGLQETADTLPGLRADLKAARDEAAKEAVTGRGLEKEIARLTGELSAAKKTLDESLIAKRSLEKDLDGRDKALADARGFKDKWSLAEERVLSLNKQLAEANRGIDALKAETGRIRAAADSRFAGIALTGRRVVFLVDMSGSMHYIDEKTPSLDKWEEVRRTLTKVMRSLPDLEKFQVLVFSDKVSFLLGQEGKWLDYDGAAAADRVEKALAKVKPDGGTNMYAALEAAFRHRGDGLDTVYLLSDGLPNMGEGLRPEEAKKLKEVEVGEILGRHIRKRLKTEWNKDVKNQPRVRINAIGFFYESPDVGAFLWALARENDGSFVGMSRP